MNGPYCSPRAHQVFPLITADDLVPNSVLGQIHGKPRTTLGSYKHFNLQIDSGIGDIKGVDGLERGCRSQKAVEVPDGGENQWSLRTRCLQRQESNSRFQDRLDPSVSTKRSCVPDLMLWPRSSGRMVPYIYIQHLQGRERFVAVRQTQLS